MFRLCAQGLAEMEELDSLLCEDEDTPGCDTPAGAGPASVEADPQGARRPDAKASAAGRNRLKALRTELKRMVQECSGGQTADCRVLEVLRDHSECLTEHEEIGA